MSRPTPHATRQALAALALLLGACGGGSDAPVDQPTSGATCPSGGSTLRYTGGGDGGAEPADFGATFFSTHCTTCHASTLTGAARQGAPLHANFDLIAVIREHSALIDQFAAKGPARTNSTMPPAPIPGPTEAERALLGTWLACGAL